MSGLLLCKARVLDFCKATPTCSKHVLVTVLLSGSTYSAMCHNYQSIDTYVIVIADICIAMYPQYANSTYSYVCLGFSYPDHTLVNSRSNLDSHHQVIQASTLAQEHGLALWIARPKVSYAFGKFISHSGALYAVFWTFVWCYVWIL